MNTESEQEFYLTPEEEEIIWDRIENDERMSSEEVKRLLNIENTTRGC